MAWDKGKPQGGLVYNTDNPEEKRTTELYNLLADHTSTYSIDDRLRACMLYATEGNMKEVERRTLIPYETLKSWVKMEWWPVALQESRKRHQDKLDSKFTQVIHKTLDQIYDRVEKGDWISKKMEPRKESK